jgi:hypothetical protein
MQHIASCLIAGVKVLVLRPSCNLDALSLASLQPLAILRSLELTCVSDQPLLTTIVLDGLDICAITHGISWSASGRHRRHSAARVVVARE